MKNILKIIIVFLLVFVLIFAGKIVVDKINKKEIKEDLSWKVINNTSGMVCTQALVKIYEDEKYTYSLPNGCYIDNYFIEFNGKKYTIKEVLENNIIKIEDLINNGVPLYKNEKEIKKEEVIDISLKYSHDITINNKKINYENNMEDEELNSFLIDFFDRYFNVMEKLEYIDMSDLFDNEENAYIYKTALDILIENRKRNKNDLSISNPKYELTIQDYKKNGDQISFRALENCSYNFNFIKQYTSSVYNIKNNFTLIKKDGKYKIKSYEKVQDFYVMVSNVYTSSKDYKSSLDKIKNDYLKKFDTTEQNFNKMLQDYLNDNYEIKKCDHEYNREDAYNYATKWVGRRNDSKWESHGGSNCVNFASQVMNAGGIPMDEKSVNKESTDKWYNYNKGKSETYSWINVDGIANYFKSNSGYGLCGKYGENIYLGQPGDLMTVGYKNDRKHAIVVIGSIKDENGKVVDLLVSSNTVDLIYYPLSAYAYPYKTLLKIYGYND